MTHLNQPWMHTTQVKALFAALEGHARFVGGCVRNALLNQDITDIDIATPLPPQDVIASLKTASIKVIPTGLKHGTVTAIMDGQAFEITTLRRDVACHGRHAEVEFTDSWEEDASRRDFTFNAMSCTSNGKVFDYFDGLEDLTHRRVRFVGNAMQRCAEDYLRILRFFRFFASYGAMPFDEEALAACTQNARHLSELSAERIQTEMFKLLVAPGTLHVLRVMHEKGIMGMLLPKHVTLDTLERFIVLEKEFHPMPDAVLRLAALLHATESPAEGAQQLAHDWRLSNKDSKRLELLTAPPCDVNAAMSIAEQKKTIRKTSNQTFCELALLQWASENNNEAMRASYVPMLELAENWQAPDFPLAGTDLIAAGIKEGKQLGQLLANAQTQWEESGYTLSKKRLLDYVHQRIK